MERETTVYYAHYTDNIILICNENKVTSTILEHFNE
jgi:hypothetical protein